MFYLVWILCFYACLVFKPFLFFTDEENLLPIFINHDLFLEIIEPKEIAYLYRIRPAIDFGMKMNYTLNGVKLVLSEPSSACESLNNDIANNVAFVERGNCAFIEKALHVEEAHGLLMIVHDDKILSDEHLVDMIAEPSINASIKLPSYFISGQDGLMIKKTMQKYSLPHIFINIPINISQIFVHNKLPPWNIW